MIDMAVGRGAVLLALVMFASGCGQGGEGEAGDPEVETRWHDEAAQIKQSEGTVVYGKKEGDWTWWHPNGLVAVRGSFKDGEEVGTWEDWHPNGNKKSVREWVAGRVEGVVQEWHDNGKMAREASYTKGRAEGAA